MKATGALLLVPLFSSFTLASFQVDNVTQTAHTCKPVLLKWEGGELPWTLSILAATDDSLLDNNIFTSQGPTSFPWTANVEAGTAVYAQVTDSTGAVVNGNTFTVQSGTNDCAIIRNKVVSSPSPTTDNGNPTVTVHTTVTTTSPPASSSSSQAAEPIPPPPSSPFSSPTSKSTPSSTPSSSSQASELSTAAGTSPTTATSLSIQYTSAAPSPSSSSSSPLSAAAPSASHISRVGMAFAILIPLLVLVIVGFLLLRRRHRRREKALSALEAQPPSPHWFDRPSYQSAAAASAFNTRAKNATQGPATQEVAFEPPPPALRPTLNIDIAPPIPTTTTPAPGSETSRTPATGLSDAESPLASADPLASKYVETLHSRIDALMAENALLAEMASSPHGGSPPPAYGLN